MQSDMTVVHEAAGFHYMYPRPLVTYQRIYGIDKPAILPDTDNSGTASFLPAGGPFGTVGTSSVYHRESRWPAAYRDWEGPDPWDPAIQSADYRLKMAYKSVGQDTRPFSNAEIFGVQVVADMSHFFTTEGQWMNQAPNYIFRSHNNGSQVWGILGEAPLRKFDANQAPILDPWNDPDTSFEVRVPADTPFHNRLIDENGITLTAEQTWHAARPGERKNSCGGCHAHSENMPPRDFSLTYAGDPASGYTVTDLALETPLLRRDNGASTFRVDPAEPNPRIKIVEWFRDIEPIVQSKCAATCHTSGQPDGELDLASPGAWDRLAYTIGSSTTKQHPTDGSTQVTRYVRKHSAAQSLLIWRIFGERLDGRTNATRPVTDIDYDPATEDPMPPPSAPQLTFDEKRLFAMWVDLGCLVDLTPPGPGDPNDPFDDQMKPVLAVSGIEAGPTTLQPSEVRIGVYDLHSGVKANSLDVRFAGSATNLAANESVADGAVVTVSLGGPLPRGQTHVLEIAVADNAGNVTRQSITTIPLHPTATTVIGPGSAGTNGVIPTLELLAPGRLGSPDFGTRVNHVLPDAFTAVLMSFALQTPPQLLAPGTPLYLDAAITLSLGQTNAAGDFDTLLPLPFLVNFSGAPLRLQAAVFDPEGAQVAPGLGVVVTPGVTAVLGW